MYLRHDTQDIQSRSPREEKVPQLEHLPEGWRRGAESEERRKGVDFGFQVEREEVVEELRVNRLKAQFDELRGIGDGVSSVSRARPLALRSTTDSPTCRPSCTPTRVGRTYRGTCSSMKLVKHANASSCEGMA